MNDVEFCQKFFQHLRRWSCGFSPGVYLCGRLHLLICVYRTIRVSLRWRGLDHDDDFVDMILNSIDNHFIEVFSPIHQGDWPLTFFFSLLFPLSLALWIGSLSSFGLRVKLALEKEFWSVPCFSMLWNSLRSIGISFSLKVWYNLSLNPYSSNLLWVGMF